MRKSRCMRRVRLRCRRTSASSSHHSVGDPTARDRSAVIESNAALWQPSRGLRRRCRDRDVARTQPTRRSDLPVSRVQPGTPEGEPPGSGSTPARSPRSATPAHEPPATTASPCRSKMRPRPHRRRCSDHLLGHARAKPRPIARLGRRREEAENNTGKPCQAPLTRTETPLRTLPTSCTGQLSTEMGGTSWSGEPIEAHAPIGDPLGEPIAALEHCPSLPFELAVVAEPVEAQEHKQRNRAQREHPAGLKVRSPCRRRDADTGRPRRGRVRDATVTLPPGSTLSLAAAHGLQACSERQIG